MKNIQIALGCDHAGFSLKEKIKSDLLSAGFEVKDYGAYSEERADYPDFAHAVAADVEKGGSLFGVIMCGSGNGINMTANKHQGIRSALCWNEEVTELARKHNDANILALPARCIGEELARKMVKLFIQTPFEGGRHEQRVKKIPLAQ